MDKHTVLRTVFGHSGFRPGQERLIDGILGGRDVFGIMPTGGGKSVCYQVPALMLDGITVVISPLISLMKDQVMALKGAGVPAAYINSSLTVDQIRAVYRNMRAKKYKIVYVAPERLSGEGFLSLARQLPISLVAVDEAHCISQWGQDFRPSYLRILEFLNSLPKRPVLAAFTATATEEVRMDILRILQLQDPVTVITGFDRPNLRYEVQRPRSKPAALLDLVKARRDRCGIVYCATRGNVEKICGKLKEQGIRATRYHAGLEPEERQKNQEDFLYDRAEVMVATNAFGMGIDKSNVSYVIHYNMPKSLEAYYQEAGRAGRDGEPAECVLLYNAGDIQTARHLIFESQENSELSPGERYQVQQQDLARLEQMCGYCKTDKCLRGYILDYFGQEHGDGCANCGNCLGDYIQRDITREAQMILSCVKRIRDKLGYSLGAGSVVAVLAGSRGERIGELRLDELSTYGLMHGIQRARIREMIDHLESEGLLWADPAHGGLQLTETAAEVLFQGAAVFMREKRTETPRSRITDVKPSISDEGLMQALKRLRSELARREGVPAYIIFTNATLADMAAKAPTDPEGFLQVSGVGQKKAERYGAQFLEVILKYIQG